MTSFKWFIPDTHAIVWHFLQNRKLSQRAREFMRGAELGDFGLVIPTIVLAELRVLYERKMPQIPLELILQRFDELANTVIAPFDLEVYGEFLQLPASLEMHDRIIAATAKLFPASLITRDPALSGIVETIW